MQQYDFNKPAEIRYTEGFDARGFLQDLPEVEPNLNPLFQQSEDIKIKAVFSKDMTEAKSILDSHLKQLKAAILHPKDRKVSNMTMLTRKTHSPASRFSRWQKQSFSSRFFQALNVTLLGIFSLSIVLPLLNIVALSFNGGKDAAMGGVYFWPRAFTVNNYIEVFSDNRLITGYGVTVARTVLGTFLSAILTGMAAFSLKKKDLPGRTVMMFLIFFTMLFSGGIIPNYMLIKAVGLRNTFAVFVIPGLYSAWNLIIMRTFFEGLGDSLEESAPIDGAGWFRIFFKSSFR